jgi:beta-phosphoglucomutase
MALTDSQPRGVLWDLDGTLVDSGDFHFQSWQIVMAREGEALSREKFAQSFGQKNDQILRHWLGPDASPQKIKQVGDDKETEYRRLARAHGLTPLPGARDWVERLRAAGWRQAIASSAPRKNIDVMLELIELAGDFDAIVSAEDVTLGKPDPQVFLIAAGRLAVSIERAVVVEDAAAGILAARRARMRSIGVSRSGLHGADVSVETLQDLSSNAFEMLIPPA